MNDSDGGQPDDIRTKGKDIVQPRLETFKEQLIPLRIWVSQMKQVEHKCLTSFQYLVLSLYNEF